MGFVIRESVIGDLEQVVAIWQEGSVQSLGGALPTGIDYMAAFRRKIEGQTDEFKIFVAVDDDGKTILGWQSLAPFRSNPATMHLMAESSTYIAPSNSASGVGRALIAHALRHADQSRLQYVTAFVTVSNPRALDGAIKAGFMPVGKFPTMHKDPIGPELVYLVYPAKKEA